MSATVTKLKPAAKPTNTIKPAKRTAPKPRRGSKALRLNRVFAGSLATMALSVTALSLDHLSAGFARIMHAPGWQAGALAVAVDISFVATELAMTCCDEGSKAAIEPYAKPLILGTLAASAGLNIMGFTAGTEGVAMVPGILAGLGVPALIYLTSRIAAKLWLR